jgi:hypothetical protein
MSVGAGPEGLRHRRRGLGRSLRSRTRIFSPFKVQVPSPRAKSRGFSRASSPAGLHDSRESVDYKR